MAFKTTTDMLKGGCHTGTPGDVDYALRTRVVCANSVIPAAGNLRIPLHVAEQAITLVSVSMVSDGGLASSATNYRDLVLGKHDGVGGAVTTFDTQGGASTAITADQKKAFTIDEATDTLAKGNVLEVASTATGTGAALGDTLFRIEYRID